MNVIVLRILNPGAKDWSLHTGERAVILHAMWRSAPHQERAAT